MWVPHSQTLPTLSVLGMVGTTDHSSVLGGFQEAVCISSCSMYTKHHNRRCNSIKAYFYRYFNIVWMLYSSGHLLLKQGKSVSTLVAKSGGRVFHESVPLRIRLFLSPKVVFVVITVNILGNHSCCLSLILFLQNENYARRL